MENRFLRTTVASAVPIPTTPFAVSFESQHRPSVETHTGEIDTIPSSVLGRFEVFPPVKVGALLYPMVNDDLKRGRIHPIEGTPIIIKTINLNAEWRDIEADMLDFVHRVEMPYSH